MMGTIFGGIAFAALIAAQIFAVLAVHRARNEGWSDDEGRTNHRMIGRRHRHCPF